MRQSATRAEESSASIPAHSEGRLPHVLVIDDDVHYGAFLRSYFRRLGIPARVAESGESAIAGCGEFQPDIILLDWFLSGGVSGEQTLMRLKSEAVAAPVVVMTAKERTPEDEAGMWQAGADFFMPKSEIAGSAGNPDAFVRRLRGILARTRRSAGAIERGRVRVEIETRRVWVSGSARRIPPRRFELLSMLALSSEGISSARLAAQGWDPSTLRKTVQRLKDDLGLRDGIVAIGQGYKLVG